jgi:hypothetical protein
MHIEMLPMNGIEVITINRELLKAVIFEIASECSKQKYCTECPYYDRKEIGSCMFDTMYPKDWIISNCDKIFSEEKSNGEITEE